MKGHLLSGLLGAGALGGGATLLSKSNPDVGQSILPVKLLVVSILLRF